MDPNDGFAQLHYGFILKYEKDYEKAIPYLQRGIASGAEGTSDGKFYTNLGDSLRRVGREAEVCLCLSINKIAMPLNRTSVSARSFLRLITLPSFLTGCAQPWHAEISGILTIDFRFRYYSKN